MFVRRIAIFLLAAGSLLFSTDIPKDFGKNVRFLDAGCSSKMDEERFLQALFYVIQGVHPDNRGLPRILVICVDDDRADFADVPKQRDGGAIISFDTMSQRGRDGLFEIWIRGSLTDQKTVSALATIIDRYYGLDPKRSIEIAKDALVMLGATVNVKDLKE